MTERVGRSFGAVVVSLCLFSQAAVAELSPAKIYKRILPSVLTLEVENFLGERFIASGFIAYQDDVVVTAWHAVADARTVWATFADGERIRVVGCVDKNGERDLALVKLERGRPGRRAELNSAVEPIAARAYVVGAPKGYGFSITDGLVSQVRQVDGFPQYQVSCPISSGNSGGPVLNDRGQVIGVASWTKSDAQNVSFAVPVSELSRLNTSAPVVPWEKMGATLRPPLASRSVNMPVYSQKQPGTLEDLQKRLQQSAGRVVTVTVREGKSEESFTITVPRKSSP